MIAPEETVPEGPAPRRREPPRSAADWPPQREGMGYSARETHPMDNYSHVMTFVGQEHRRDYLSVRWRAWIPDMRGRDNDRDRHLRYKVTHEYAIVLAASLSLLSEDRKRASLSLSVWSAPTELDNDNMAEVGTLLDDQNTAILDRGVPVPFKFRNLRARCCTSPRCKKRREVPLAVMAELDPSGAAVHLMFVPGHPTVYMRIASLHGTAVHPRRSKRSLERCPGYWPDAPEPATSAADRHKEDLERREAKRRRRQEALGIAAPDAAPAAAPAAAQVFVDVAASDNPERPVQAYVTAIPVELMRPPTPPAQPQPQPQPPPQPRARGPHPRWREVVEEAREATAAINELMARGRETIEGRAIALTRLAVADEALDLVQDGDASNEQIDRVLRRMHDATEAARTASEADDRLRETTTALEASPTARAAVANAWSQLPPGTAAQLLRNELDEDEEEDADVCERE